MRFNINLDDYGHLSPETLLDSLESLGSTVNLYRNGRISNVEMCILIVKDERIHDDVRRRVLTELLGSDERVR